MSEEPLDRRRLGRDLDHSVRNLTDSIRDLRLELVRKDVYEANQKDVERQLLVIERGVESNRQLVEKIEERRVADRRLLITAFVLPIFLMLFQLYLASQTGTS